MSTDELWSECLHIPCGYCQASVGERCVNRGADPVCVKHTPCGVRLRAAVAHKDAS